MNLATIHLCDNANQVEKTRTLSVLENGSVQFDAIDRFDALENAAYVLLFNSIWFIFAFTITSN